MVQVEVEVEGWSVLDLSVFQFLSAESFLCL